jgi:ABC-type transport system substrate-binding protein
MASRMSRRQALKLVSGLASIGILAACSQPPAPAPKAESKPAEPAKPAEAANKPAATSAPAAAKPAEAPKPADAAKPAADAGPAATQKPAGSGFTKPVNIAVRATRSPNYALWVETGSVLSTMPYIAMGLALQNAKGGMEPWLASGWEMDASGSTLTVKLRPEAKWSDGKPVTADDVAWNWHMWVNAQPWGKGSPQSLFFPFVGAKAYNAGTADKVEGIQVVDPKTIVVKLDPPNPLWTIGGPIEWCILPKHVFEGWPAEKLKEHPYVQAPTVGSGPYQFVKYELDQYIEMKRWDDWWGNAIWKQPAITSVFAKQLTVPTSLVQLERNETHVAWVQDFDQVDRFRSMPNVELHQVPSLAVRAYEINGRQPYLKDKRVRQAFDFALDKEAIRKTILAGTGRIATSTIVGPDWALNPSLKPRPYDPDRAKALLKEAGWDFNRRLTYFQYLIPPLGEAFQGYMEQIGVGVDLKVVPDAMVVPEKDKGEYDVVLVGGGYFARDPSESKIFKSGSGTSKHTGYSNPELDKLLTDGEATADPQKRAPIYHKAAEILHDELPWIVFAHEDTVWGVSKELGGFQPAAANTRASMGLESWFWK